MLLLLGLALIFNKSICNFLIGHQSNHYQINKVSKKRIKDNQNAKVTYDFSVVEPVTVESVLKAQSANVDLPVIGGIAYQILVLISQFLKGWEILSCPMVPVP